jgi:hypothetical protein
MNVVLAVGNKRANLRLSWRWMKTVPSFSETPDLRKRPGLLLVRKIHPYLILQAGTNNVNICI